MTLRCRRFSYTLHSDDDFIPHLTYTIYSARWYLNDASESLSYYPGSLRILNLYLDCTLWFHLLTSPHPFTMSCIRLCLRQLPRSIFSSPYLRYQSSGSTTETDECGIPIQPTWSVNELLTSYSTPKIPSKTLKHLYELSALIPPTEGTIAHEKITRQMEEMVRLVEAVKLINTDGVMVMGRWEREDTDRSDSQQGAESSPKEDSTGQALLNHASRTMEGFYIVEADRTRTS